MVKEIKMYAIIDTETSGGKYNEEKIIEIAIIIYDGKNIIDTFTTLIKPNVKVDYFVQKFTGIKNSDLVDKKTFKDYAELISNLVSNKIIVGHNVEYDYRILKNELETCNIKFSSETICTIKMSKEKYNDLKYYNLNYLCNYFNIKLKNHHRAYDDAFATLELFKILNKWIN